MRGADPTRVREASSVLPPSPLWGRCPEGGGGVRRGGVCEEALSVVRPSLRRFAPQGFGERPSGAIAHRRLEGVHEVSEEALTEAAVDQAMVV
jgi:hypothetical protein